MDYIIATDKASLEAFQAEADAAYGYPEQENQFTNVGLGPHADWTVGRAMHHAEIITDQTGLRFALPYTALIVDVPEGATVGELPEDWYPDIIL